MRRAVGFLVLALGVACQTPVANQSPQFRASSALQEMPVFDGHSDFAIHYLSAAPAWSVEAHDITLRLPGQVDIPRWRAGHVSGMLVTVASDQPSGSARHFPRLLASLDWFDALIARHSEQLRRASSVVDLRATRRAGQIALIPAIEGGEQIDGSLDNLRTAYERGVRSMTIVYDQHNVIGDGAMVLEQSRAIAAPPNGGLSAFGREVVLEMNGLGMLIDLSHAAETTALQAMSVSQAPVIFSHSGARSLADTPRNLSDATLRALGRNGGVVMVPFSPYLTTSAHWRWWSSGEAHYVLLESQHPGDDAAVRRGMAEWDRANPQPLVALSDVADQIDYIARVAGHAHVGIGSDFDGMGDFVIPDLADSSRLPALFAELARRGWTADQIRALAWDNFERVLSHVERVSG